MTDLTGPSSPNIKSIISDDGKIVTTSGDKEKNTSELYPCTSFFGADIGYVGIRNNCDKCVTAVVQWSGYSYPWEYKLQAFSSIIVPIQGQNGQLIGESPC